MLRKWKYYLNSHTFLRNVIAEKELQIEAIKTELIKANFKFKHRLQLDIYSEGTEIGEKIVIDKHDVVLKEINVKTPETKWFNKLIKTFGYNATFLTMTPQLIFHCTDWKNKKQITLTLDEVERLHEYK